MSLVSKLQKATEKKADKETKLRDAKCEPAAEEIFQKIALFKPSAKKISFEEAIKEYGPIQVDINTMFKKGGFTISEVNYTWSIVQSMLDMVKRLSNESIQKAFEIAEEKLWAVDSVKDVTLQKIDDVLILK